MQKSGILLPVKHMKQFFHGPGKRGPYFEGWYFRCVTPEGVALALIPALHIPREGAASASLQIITPGESHFLTFPIGDFSADVREPAIRVGENRFSAGGLSLNIRRSNLTLTGRLTFGVLHPLKSDIMGPFRFLPGLECVHSVFSMGHTLAGQLRLNGTALDFTGGRGYIEGDRGSSFPARYLWSYCVFPGGSAMVSMAEIPVGSISFTGCTCAIVRGSEEIRIATYRGAAVKTLSPRRGEIVQGQFRLEITLPEDAGFTLSIDAMSDDFESDFETTMRNGNYVCGDGRCRINVNALSGDVVIHKASPANA